MVSERAGAQGPVARRSPSTTAWTWSTADPLRLKQVILNLLTNAVKFTPAGGRIEFTRSARRGRDSTSPCSDSGIGIAESDQARIFEAFQQGGGAVSASAEGTGLGLTLSKRIVELHGGRLWVTSRVGHGSTFTFSIPDSGPVSEPAT